ncbi:MAG: phage replisome organizer N-terminal domain-containing protein [bacterium]
MRQRTGKDWIPLWVDKWLWGSTRLELSPEERGIFIDLIAIASKDDGYIRANPTIAYPLEQLSGMLCLTKEQLENAINKCIQTEKIEKLPNGIIKIKNWETYQLSNRQDRKIRTLTAENQIGSQINSYFGSPIIKCPEKFISMANKNGQVRLNRLIVAIILNRNLLPTEEVHHINGKETDNNPRNLMLFANHKDHTQYEWGYDIKPLWNGQDLSEDQLVTLTADLSALTAEKTALYNYLYNYNYNYNNINNKEKEKKEKEK